MSVFNAEKLNWKKHFLAMTLVLSAIVATSVLIDERVAEGNGLGWDGQRYAEFALNWDDFVANKRIDAYYFGKIFPSCVIYFLLKLLSKQPTAEDVISIYLFWNTTMLFVALWAYINMLKCLKLSPLAAWVGFAGLFMNYANAKMPFYYPVLTDTTGFCLGMLMLMSVILKHRLVLIGTTFLCAFSWPQQYYIGLILLLFFQVTKEHRSNYHTFQKC